MLWPLILIPRIWIKIVIWSRYKLIWWYGSIWSPKLTMQRWSYPKKEGKLKRWKEEIVPEVIKYNNRLVSSSVILIWFHWLFGFGRCKLYHWILWILFYHCYQLSTQFVFYDTSPIACWVRVFWMKLSSTLFRLKQFQFRMLTQSTSFCVLT